MRIREDDFTCHETTDFTDDADAAFISSSRGLYSMIDAGYFAKCVAPKPDWLHAPSVREICSASNCVSLAPEDWVDQWLHNEFGWFNRISDALAVVPPDRVGAYRLFGYRIYPQMFRAGARHELVVPSGVRPDPIPETFELLGFDSVSKSMESILGFECSPLSCNSIATEMDTNEHCLFHSLEAAVAGATRFSIEQPEPGDYYVVEVLDNRSAAQLVTEGGRRGLDPE